jgi:peroxiredoxin Q/BCP
LLSDTEKTVHELYGAWGEKKIFGITRIGTIRSTFLIDPDGNLVYQWKNVKVKDHVKKVFEKFIELKN